MIIDTTARSVVTFTDGTVVNLPTQVAGHVTGADDVGPVVDYRDGGSGPFYATPCCGAPISIFTDGGAAYCKNCYGDADLRLGSVPEGPLAGVVSVVPAT